MSVRATPGVVDVNTLAVLIALVIVPMQTITSSAPPSPERQPAEIEQASGDDQTQALELCRGLYGYDAVVNSFRIDSATLGDFADNDFDEALAVELRPIDDRVIDLARWLNPLRGSGAPKYDWATFAKLYASAASAVSRQAWLSTWRAASTGRTIEVEFHGDHIGEDKFEIQTFILPVWRAAGFAGRPAFSVLARRSGREWAQIYLGDRERRALVTEVSGVQEKPLHWLDGLHVFFHPRCVPHDESSQYAVIEPSGQWQVMTYGECEP